MLLVLQHVYHPPGDSQPSVLFSRSSQSWRHTQTRAESTRDAYGRDPFSSFARSDIWNKEASYVSSSFWDRQSDTGQILPARQINRPRRVGSLQDDSFIHTQGNRNTHTKCTLFTVQTLLKHQLWKATTCNRANQRKMLDERSKEINLTLSAQPSVSSAAQVKVLLVGLPVWLPLSCCW